MPDSSYYYSLYKQKRNAVNDYEDNLRDLRKALSNLTDTMGDEIGNINNELDDLKSDLNKGIRHNYQFTSRANEVTEKKEKAVTADPNLSIAVSELQDEITRVDGLKNEAVSDREDYYRQYETKKDKERQEFWDKIF